MYFDRLCGTENQKLMQINLSIRFEEYRKIRSSDAYQTVNITNFKIWLVSKCFCSFCQGSNFDKNTCAVTKDSENPWFVLAFGTKTTFSEVAITGRSKTEDTEMLCKKSLALTFKRTVSTRENEQYETILHDFKHHYTLLFMEKPKFKKPRA